MANKKELSVWKFALIAFVFFMVWVGYFLLMKDMYPPDEKANIPNIGIFGDMFGGLNAIFSGLTLAGIIFTILAQREEMTLQREEMALQRTEMVETRHEFQINRITNIIYSQISRIDQAITPLILKERLKGDLKGNGWEALHAMIKQLKKANPELNKMKNSPAEVPIDFYLLENNKDSIFKLIEIIYQSSKSVFRTIQFASKKGTDSIGLTDNENKELSYLFFDNIGEVVFIFLEELYYFITFYQRLIRIPDEEINMLGEKLKKILGLLGVEAKKYG